MHAKINLILQVSIVYMMSIACVICIINVFLS